MKCHEWFAPRVSDPDYICWRETEGRKRNFQPQRKRKRDVLKLFVGAAGCDLHPDRLCTVFSVQHVLSPFKLNTKDVTQCRPTTLQTFNNLRNVSLIWLECKNTVKLPVTPHFKRKRSKRISWMMIQPRREADTDWRKRSWNVSSDVKLLYSVWEERRSIIIRFKTETQNSLFSINSRN